MANATVQALDLKAKLFRGLADPSRLAILQALHAGPCSVTEIVEATSLNQPNVSSHLSCLRECGLVVREQEGRNAFYTLADERVPALLRLSDELLADVAKGIYECTRF